jgi:hypothetical protein
MESMRRKSGADSVQASQELQALNQAASAPQMRQGEARLAYRDRDGALQNAAQQVRVVLGRAFYQHAGQWIDSRLQTSPAQKTQRIRFASEEYFSLLRRQPEAARIMALGQNVLFMQGGQAYEVTE